MGTRSAEKTLLSGFPRLHSVQRSPQTYMQAYSGTDARRRCRDALPFSREGKREALIIIFYFNQGKGDSELEAFPHSFSSPHSHIQRGVGEEEEQQQQPFS